MGWRVFFLSLCCDMPPSGVRATGTIHHNTHNSTTDATAQRNRFKGGIRTECREISSVRWKRVDTYTLCATERCHCRKQQTSQQQRRSAAIFRHLSEMCTSLKVIHVKTPGNYENISCKHPLNARKHLTELNCEKWVISVGPGQSSNQSITKSLDTEARVRL